MSKLKRSSGGGPGSHRNKPMEKAKDFKTSFRRLFRFFGPQKGILFLAAIILIASTVLNAIAPAILGSAITQYLERSKNIPRFVVEMVTLLVIYLSAFGANALGSVLVSVASNRVIFRMRKEAFDHVQKLSVSYFDRTGLGDIISRLTNDVDIIYNFLSNGLIGSVTGLLSIVGVLIAMFILNIPMTLVLLLVFPIIMVIMSKLGAIVQKAAIENQMQVGALTGAIEESVSGIKVIQSFNREEEEREKFDRVNKEAREAGVRMETSSYMMMPMMMLINGLTLVLVIGFGGAMVILNPSVYSIGLVTAFIVYARRFMEPFRQLSNIYSLFNTALAGAERIFEVLDCREIIPVPENPDSVESLKGEVAFKSVSFGYVPEKKVLKDISVEVAPGDLTAIVGPTGAGKTTLINLLTRFYDIHEGEILIDGKNIKKYDPRALRSKMGLVLQEPFFFATTIKENLLYGRPEASDEELMDAAKMAGAHHFISCLPSRYDTLLTERGMNLSQGERQLLGIARTILTDPKILILDEATSNVDSLTEKHIQKAVSRLMKGRTSFVIAHRLSTIKKAHRVLVIHDHKIIEEGTHSELMAAGGFYHQLYTMQFEQVDIREENFGTV